MTCSPPWDRDIAAGHTRRDFRHLPPDPTEKQLHEVVCPRRSAPSVVSPDGCLPGSHAGRPGRRRPGLGFSGLGREGPGCGRLGLHYAEDQRPGRLVDRAPESVEEPAAQPGRPSRRLRAAPGTGCRQPCNGRPAPIAASPDGPRRVGRRRSGHLSGPRPRRHAGLGRQPRRQHGLGLRVDDHRRDLLAVERRVDPRRSPSLRSGTDVVSIRDPTFSSPFIPCASSGCFGIDLLPQPTPAGPCGPRHPAQARCTTSATRRPPGGAPRRRGPARPADRGQLPPRPFGLPAGRSAIRGTSLGRSTGRRSGVQAPASSAFSRFSCSLSLSQRRRPVPQPA